MDLPTFGTLPVGGCFCIGAILAVHAFEEHVLRKTDDLHAEYLDGSGAVLVPEGSPIPAVASSLPRRSSPTAP